MASPSLPTHPGSIPRRSSPYLLAFPVGLLVLVSLTLIHLFPAMTSSPGHHLPPLGGHQRPFPAPSHGNNSASFKIGTLNLRYDGGWRETVPVGHSGDGREEKAGGGPGERPWSERRWRIRDMLHFLDPDIVGFQEALDNQVLDLEGLLGASWSHVGVGRDDGDRAGEYAPIYFRNDRFEALAVEYVWLSQTPQKVGSRGWDASQPRIATILTLLDHQSSSLIHVANTHWDDQGLVAREESGKLLRRILPETARKAEAKLGRGDGKKLAGVVLLMGDLNSPAAEKGYQALTSPLSSSLSTPPFHFLPTLLPSNHFAYGPKTTYTGFHGFPSDSPTEIDFIFLYDESVASEWGVERYGVVEPGMDEREQEVGVGRWRGKLSDHRYVGGQVVRRGKGK